MGLSMSLSLRSKHLQGALVACALSALGAAPAQAQFFGYWPGFGSYRTYELMSPRDIIASVREQGFVRPSRPVFQGQFYVVDASDRRGYRVRLFVDSYSGGIRDAVVLAEPRVVNVPRATRPRDQAPRRELQDRDPEDNVVQRAPDAGTQVPRTRPLPPAPVRTTPAERPEVPRAQPTQPRPPAPATQPRAANPQPAAPGSVGTGTREAPRRIDIAPPAPLDEVRPQPRQAPGAPINSVPPAILD
jgi:hypothetical protein